MKEVQDISGWFELISKIRKSCGGYKKFSEETKKVEYMPFVSDAWISKTGNLYTNLNFKTSKKKKEYYIDHSNNRQTIDVNITGTSINTKRRCWEICIKAMIKSEYICPVCGSKRKKLEDHCG